MKLLNIVIVLALACVPVQSTDAVKNLRGEKVEKVAPKTDESGSADVGVPAKESDPNTGTESEGPSAVGVPEKELDATVPADSGDSGDSTDGAVLAELDAGTEAEATEGEEDLLVRTCRRWVTCHDGWYGGIRCSGGRYCTLWR